MAMARDSSRGPLAASIRRAPTPCLPSAHAMANPLGPAPTIRIEPSIMLLPDPRTSTPAPEFRPRICSGVSSYQKRIGLPKVENIEQQRLAACKIGVVEKVVTKFKTLEEADTANRKYYQALTPKERIDMLIQMIDDTYG